MEECRRSTQSLHIHEFKGRSPLGRLPCYSVTDFRKKIGFGGGMNNEGRCQSEDIVLHQQPSTSELSKLLQNHYQKDHQDKTHDSQSRPKERRGSITRRISQQAAQRAKFLVIETQAMTFYACVTVLSLFLVMLFCVSLSIVNLDRYNFALYYFLLCLVGIMLSCAFCIAHPKACPNPKWYNRCCQQVMELYPEKPNDDDPSSVTATQSQMPYLRGATAFMLTPAMHLMQSMWRGMAWVAEGIEEEDTATQEHTALKTEVEMELGTTILNLTSTLVGENSSSSASESDTPINPSPTLPPLIEELDETFEPMDPPSHSTIIHV